MNFMIALISIASALGAFFIGKSLGKFLRTKTSIIALLCFGLFMILLPDSYVLVSTSITVAYFLGVIAWMGAFFGAIGNQLSNREQ